MTRLAYIIKIGDRILSIKGVFINKIIYSSDIRSINLFSKEGFMWSFGFFTTISVRIELETGKRIIIADPFYRNISQIKKSLSENFNEKINPPKILKEQPTTGTIPENDPEKFAGNPYTSYNGIVIVGWPIFILVLFIFIKRPLAPPDIFFPVGVILLYLGCGNQLHYFLISNQHLTVKNHVFPWVNKSYNLADIVEANFETPPNKRSKSLRITTRDFRTKVFTAGSLREKHWTQLREKLESLSINFVG